MFSCGRMIRLLAHLLPPLSIQKVVSFSHSSCVSLVELKLTEEEGKGWARSRIIRYRESPAIYKSFNTLWSKLIWNLVVEKHGGSGSWLFLCCKYIFYVVWRYEHWMHWAVINEHEQWAMPRESISIPPIICSFWFLPIDRCISNAFSIMILKYLLSNLHLSMGER